MHLIIDIGNSRVKYFFEENTYYDLENLSKALQAEGNSAKKLSVLTISTVPEKVDQVMKDLKKTLAAAGIEIEKLEHFDPESDLALANGGKLKNLYKGIGADRVAKIIGAINLFSDDLQVGDEVLVMDFGTATTLTAAVYTGEDFDFANGYISLGFRKTFETLEQSTSQLPNPISETKFEDLDADMEMSPMKAIADGTYLAHHGLVDVWLAESVMKAHVEYPESKIITVCTGGAAKYFQESFEHYLEERELYQASYRSAARSATTTRSIPA